jgi:hypothetical protein
MEGKNQETANIIELYYYVELEDMVYIVAKIKR